MECFLPLHRKSYRRIGYLQTLLPKYLPWDIAVLRSPRQSVPVPHHTILTVSCSLEVRKRNFQFPLLGQEYFLTESQSSARLYKYNWSRSGLYNRKSGWMRMPTAFLLRIAGFRFPHTPFPSLPSLVWVHLQDRPSPQILQAQAVPLWLPFSFLPEGFSVIGWLLHCSETSLWARHHINDVPEESDNSLLHFDLYSVIFLWHGHFLFLLSELLSIPLLIWWNLQECAPVSYNCPVPVSARYPLIQQCGCHPDTQGFQNFGHHSWYVYLLEMEDNLTWFLLCPARLLWSACRLSHRYHIGQDRLQTDWAVPFLYAGCLKAAFGQLHLGY